MQLFKFCLGASKLARTHSFICADIPVLLFVEIDHGMLILISSIMLEEEEIGAGVILYGVFIDGILHHIHVVIHVVLILYRTYLVLARDSSML